MFELLVESGKKSVVGKLYGCKNSSKQERSTLEEKSSGEQEIVQIIEDADNSCSIVIEKQKINGLCPELIAR